MGKIILDAEDVRNDLLKNIDLVAQSKEPIFIKRNGKIKVVLSPVTSEELFDLQP